MKILVFESFGTVEVLLSLILETIDVDSLDSGEINLLADMRLGKKNIEHEGNILVDFG